MIISRSAQTSSRYASASTGSAESSASGVAHKDAYHGMVLHNRLIVRTIPHKGSSLGFGRNVISVTRSLTICRDSWQTGAHPGESSVGSSTSGPTG